MMRWQSALALILVLLALFLGYRYWESYRLKHVNDFIAPFSADGRVTGGGPGQKADTWYLISEVSGSSAISTELVFDRIEEPALTAGDRVHVDGQYHSGIVSVTSLTKLEATEAGRKVVLYYYDPSRDQGPGGAQCSEKGLVAVTRTIPQTATPLSDSIRLLLRGEIAEDEKARGITSGFPLPGLELLKATIEDGIATLTFGDPLHKTIGGACRTSILWKEIEATALQYKTVKSVRFEPADLFQP